MLPITTYGSAGAWGARVVPPAIRRALDGGRLPVMLAVLAAELLALAVFAGVGVGLLAVPPDPGVPRWLVWLAGGTFLAAAGGAVVWVAEAVTRIWWRGRRRGGGGRRRHGIRMTVGTAPSGMPATVVARSRASLVTPWDRLPPAVPGAAALEVPRDATSAEHRSFPVDIPTDVVDRVPRDVVPVPATYLWAPAEEVCALVELARGRPVLRRHLGTRASLEWHVEPPSSPVS